MKVLFLVFIYFCALIGADKFTVDIGCDKLPAFMKVCNVTALDTTLPVTKHQLKDQRVLWGYGDMKGKPFVGQVEVRYLDGSVTKVLTGANGRFTVDIIPDKPFYVFAYDYNKKKWSTHAYKFVLRISRTGKELWRVWKPSTHRWQTLDTSDKNKIQMGFRQ